MKKESIEYNKMCGERLKKALDVRNMRQKQLADKVNFTAQYISDICCGRRQLSHENAHLFAEKLNIRAEYLLCIDDHLTEDERRKQFFSEIGESVKDGTLEQKFDVFQRRVTFANDILKKCIELYGFQEKFEALSFEEASQLIFYLDESIYHNLKMYFALFEPKDTKAVANRASIVSSMMDEAISAAKKVIPENMTDEDFFSEFAHNEAFENKVLEQIRPVFGLKNE